MEIDPIVPIFVAVIGLLQIGISLWAGRRQSKATAVRDEAVATKEIGQTYRSLVETLEVRLSTLEVKYQRLGDEYGQLEEKYEMIQEDYLELKRNCREVLAAKEKLEKKFEELKGEIKNGNGTANN